MNTVMKIVFILLILFCTKSIVDVNKHSIERLKRDSVTNDIIFIMISLMCIFAKIS